MTIMRPIRNLATALLVAMAYAAGCGTSQPDQPTTPPSQPPVVTAPPTPAPPTPTPRPQAPPPAHASVDGHQPHPPGREVSWSCPPGPAPHLPRPGRQHPARWFYLTPTGTGMFNENQLIGQDTNGRDGWSLAWRCKDEPCSPTHRHRGRRQRHRQPGVTLGLHHPDPVARILSVTTIPTLPREGGFLRLPAGAGKLLFRVQTVNNTQRVRFYLSPTGTDTSARLLGEDTNGRDGGSSLELPEPTPDRPPHRQCHRIRRDQPRQRPRPVLTPTPPADATNRMRTLESWARSVARGELGPAPAGPTAICETGRLPVLPCQSRRRMR